MKLAKRKKQNNYFLNKLKYAVVIYELPTY